MTSTPEGAPAAEPDVDEPVMDLLAEHVPLTLIVDLAATPPSEELLEEEGLPADPWWDRGSATEEPG